MPQSLSQASTGLERECWQAFQIRPRSRGPGVAPIQPPLPAPVPHGARRRSCPASILSGRSCPGRLTRFCPPPYVAWRPTNGLAVVRRSVYARTVDAAMQQPFSWSRRTSRC